MTSMRLGEKDTLARLVAPSPAAAPPEGGSRQRRRGGAWRSSPAGVPHPRPPDRPGGPSVYVRPARAHGDLRADHPPEPGDDRRRLSRALALPPDGLNPPQTMAGPPIVLFDGIRPRVILHLM